MEPASIESNGNGANPLAGKKGERDLRKEMRDIKSEHLKEMRELKTNFKNELDVLRKRFEGQLRNERDLQKKTYEKQRLILKKDQENLVKSELRTVVQNYASLATSYQKEIEANRRIQCEHDDAVQKRDSEIAQLRLELAKSASDLQAKRMIVQLAERNALIERLQFRIEELEALVAQRHGQEDEQQLEVGEEHAFVDNDSFGTERMHDILEGTQRRYDREYSHEDRLDFREDPVQAMHENPSRSKQSRSRLF